MFNVIVAGSRNFNDYELLTAKLDKILSKRDNVQIVSGGARGADSLGDRYAKEHNLPLKIFPANWDLYGRSAGYRRNEQMAEYADALVAFWDGESHGTKHMIETAQAMGLPLRVVFY